MIYLNMPCHLFCPSLFVLMLYTIYIYTILVNTNNLVMVAKQIRNYGKLDYLYGLYSSFARQQGTDLISVF